MLFPAVQWFFKVEKFARKAEDSVRRRRVVSRMFDLPDILASEFQKICLIQKTEFQKTKLKFALFLRRISQFYRQRFLTKDWTTFHIFWTRT
jgi:hypothetical protein